MRSFFRYLLTILIVLFFSLSVVLAATTAWLFNVWSDLTVEEILFHLQVSLEGTNVDMIRQYLVNYGLPCLIAIVSLIFFFILIRNTVKAYRIALLATFVVSFGLMTFAVWNLESNLGLFEYLQSQLVESTFIEDHYVDPKNVELSFPKKKRNIIYIYMESLETTFADEAAGGAFPKNIIPNLTRLARNNVNFSGDPGKLNGGISLFGSTWTMGGLFAQSCGLPLKTSLDGNSLETQKTFFADVTTLGDILEEHGYKNVFMLGSDVVFGGRQLYYSQHGNYDIEDYYYAENHGLIPQGYFNFWGFEDEKLYAMAKDRLTQLASQDQPFNLTMLTVDTHFEDGNLCRLCKDDFGEQYANVFACADRQVCSFVQWIQQQDFYENTTIIINGDHPTMDKDFCKDVPGDYQRKTYTLIINPAVEPEDKSYRTYSTMDMFPTTLAAMGVTIPGNRLGLGVDLFSGEKTLIEKMGKNRLDAKLRQHSAFLDKLANVEFDETVLTRMRKSSALAWENWDKKKKTARMWFKLGYVLDLDMVEKVEAQIELVTPKEYRTGREALTGAGFKIDENGFITDAQGNIISDLESFLKKEAAPPGSPKENSVKQDVPSGRTGSPGDDRIYMENISRDEEAALVCSTELDLSGYLKGSSNFLGEPIIRVTAYLTTSQGRRYEIFTKYQNLTLLFEDDMDAYLKKMKEENRSIFMAGQYDTSGALTDRNKESLKALGLKSDLSSEHGASFYGIVKHGVVTEGFRQKSLRARGYTIRYGIPLPEDSLTAMLTPVSQEQSVSSRGLLAKTGTGSDSSISMEESGQEIPLVGLPSEELSRGRIDLIPDRAPMDWTVYGRYPFSITSCGINDAADQLPMSYIKISNVEYSRRRPGLNVVVWDEDLGAVVDSVNFDIYKGTGTTRWK